MLKTPLFSLRENAIAKEPALVDLAPSILAEFGLPVPSSMTDKSIFT